MTIIYHLMIFVVARLSLFAARIAQHSSGLGGKWPGPLHTVGRYLGRRLHLQLQLLINTFPWQPLKLAWEFKPLSFCS